MFSEIKYSKVGMTLRKFLLWLGKACIAGILAIEIVSVPSIWYQHSGGGIPNPNGATDFIAVPNSYLIQHKEGFSIIHYDKNGYNNCDVDDERSVDVLVMGDSHIDAAYVPQRSNFIYLMNQMNPSQYAYNIGVSGHHIYSCTRNMENAIRAYHPSHYVVMNIETAEMDEDDMRAVLNGEFPYRSSHNYGPLYILRKIAPSFFTIYKNMQDWLTLNPTTEAPEQVIDYGSASYVALLNDFLAMAAEPVAQSGAQLVILYMPTTELDAEGNLVLDSDPVAMEVFRAACERNGIRFVDMSEDFCTLYETEHRLPYGFINTRVGGGHLNEAGHRVIAERLTRELAME